MHTCEAGCHDFVAFPTLHPGETVISAPPNSLPVVEQHGHRCLFNLVDRELRHFPSGQQSARTAVPRRTGVARGCCGRCIGGCAVLLDIGLPAFLVNGAKVEQVMPGCPAAAKQAANSSMPRRAGITRSCRQAHAGVIDALSSCP